jgi:hypothetical protein
MRLWPQGILVGRLLQHLAVLLQSGLFHFLGRDQLGKF